MTRLYQTGVNWLLLILVGLFLCFGYFSTQSKLIDLYKCYGLGYLRGGTALIADTPRYLSCILTVSPDDQPFRTVPREYPFPSILLMLIPLLLSEKFYSLWFILLIWIFIVLTFTQIRKYFSQKSALLYLLLTFLVGFGYAVGRLDIVMGFFILTTLINVKLHRYKSAYFLLAVCTALKIFPVILLPVIFISENRDRLNHLNIKHLSGLLLYFGLTILFFLYPFRFGLISGLSPFLYNISRPSQIESIPANVLGLLAKITNTPISVQFGYGSFNLVHASQHPSILFSLTWLFLALVIIGIYLTTLRMLYQRKLDAFQSGLLLIHIFLIANKVFSPQYILWIIPLWAILLPHRKRFVISVLLISALTGLIYPFGYNDLSVKIPPLFTGHLFFFIWIRNLTFILFTFLYFRSLSRQIPLTKSPGLHKIAHKTR